SETMVGVRRERARKVYARAAKLPNIQVTGVDMHIGSQITDLGPLGDAFKVLVDFVGVLRAGGHSITHLELCGRRARPTPRHGGPAATCCWSRVGSWSATPAFSSRACSI